MNHLDQYPSLATKTFNVLLWILQVLWGVFFSFTSFGKVLCYDPAGWNRTLHQVAWFSAVPQGLIVVIGAREGLGGIGLILPAMTGIKPKLAPFAAIGLWSSQLYFTFARRVHLVRARQFGAGRSRRIHRVWAVDGQAYRGAVDEQPLMLTGFAVLGALVVVGFAPCGTS